MNVYSDNLCVYMCVCVCVQLTCCDYPPNIIPPVDSTENELLPRIFWGVN